jgi:hypothetical protein
MELEQDIRIKYTFSGHESFQCRQLWLKKGYDFLKSGKSFSDEDAVVVLGVGKNMVASIRYWLKAFNITNLKDEITEFGDMLLGDDGFDPYLEDDASLWLLHFQLASSGYASIYNLIFNDFRKEKIQFNRDNFVAFIKRKSETDSNLSFNPKTVGDDFDVFKKLYLATNEDGKATEDSFSGLLSDLGLVKTIGKGKDELCYIENSERESLPFEILLYLVAKNEQLGVSINLSTLEQDYNSPGSIFALNRSGLLAKISDATEKYKALIYTDHAGIKELQIKEKLSPFQILKDYYEN